MQKLHNYILGQWAPGDGDGVPQYHAITGALVSTASSEGLDYAAILDYGRKKGGPVLRRMTFPERGRMLKALALYLLERKEKYYQVSHKTGATRADSWVDLEVSATFLPTAASAENSPTNRTMSKGKPYASRRKTLLSGTIPGTQTRYCRTHQRV